ncbi:Hypothetical predicted protein [Olea europaea subsp. europaea]|uniref:Uncharacterized protein n=1 Tax=Olea europaea subsp. europaea TaxID=158383 RepID=A0A8S0R508_OLEEU|nr:Hypothetical predicted protein [Olea europaea subsp. europaea]
MRLREFEGKLGQFTGILSGWEEGHWVVMAIGYGVRLRAIGTFSLAGLGCWVRLLLRPRVEEPESWLKGDLHVLIELQFQNRLMAPWVGRRDCKSSKLSQDSSWEFSKWVGRRALGCNGNWVWVRLRTIGPFFLAGLDGRVRGKNGPFGVGPEMFNGNARVKEYLRELGCFALRLRLLLRLWAEEQESWMRRDLYVPDQISIRESIASTLGGKMRLGEFEGKLGQFARFLNVGGGEGLWVVMAIGFLIEVKEYLCELGYFALQVRLLLRLWVEEPKSWMREDLHVPNRTSIPKSINGSLGGKMRLREFEGKLGQFVGILKVGGEKGFGL